MSSRTLLVIGKIDNEQLELARLWMAERQLQPVVLPVTSRNFLLTQAALAERYARLVLQKQPEITEITDNDLELLAKEHAKAFNLYPVAVVVMDAYTWDLWGEDEYWPIRHSLEVDNKPVAVWVARKDGDVEYIG